MISYNGFTMWLLMYILLLRRILLSHAIFQCDQAKEGLVNNRAQMDEYCRDKGFTTWFETSAKENVNIDEAARCLVSKVTQKMAHS